MNYSIEADRFSAPWLPELLELLALRRGARVLQVGGEDPRVAAALLEEIGPDGRLLVLEADAGRADHLTRSIEHPSLHVLSYAPDGDEAFGHHDAFLACPLCVDDRPLLRWGRLAVANLRPGGQFAVDLPAESPCEVLFAAWAKAGGDDAALAPLRGPTPEALAARMRESGLRRVESLVGTHLVRAETTFAFAEFAARTLGHPELIDSLHVALCERLGTNGSVDIVFHRTRVHGMR